MTYRTNELYHHGILGQKWGIRRYQNKDGTLTEMGKVHYKEIDSDVKRFIESNSDRVGSIISSGEKLVSMANKLGDDYTKAFSSFKMTDKIKNELMNNLHEDFGNGVDDSEYFKWGVEEKVYENLDMFLPKSVKDSRLEYEKAQNDYWDEVEDFSKDLVSKYKGLTIDDDRFIYTKDGERVASNILYKSLETDWPSYLYRHFDDYWIYDTPEFTSMTNKITAEITMDEYNKRFGN